MNKIKSKNRKTIRVVLIVVVLLVAVRLALPYVILHYANKTLATMKGYRGQIQDIDLAIIRGAYKIDSIYLHKMDTVTLKETPFFAASGIDLSVEWKALFHGAIVGELVFSRPMIRFTKDKVEPDDVRKDSTDFKKLLDDFMPLRVNRFEVNNGIIQYIDEHSSPKVDVALTNTNVLALNLINSYDSSSLLPASITASASVYEGSLLMNMKLDPLAKVPTFDLNAELQNTNLVKLNDFFKAYARVDVNKGTFGLYTEIAAKDGQFAGYVKPLIKDLDVLGEEDRKDNVLQKLWEGIAGGVGEIFENQPRDRLATKVPFRGEVENPKANVWYAVVRVLQNAFVRALQPAIDQDITIATIKKPKPEKKTTLEKVFTRDEAKKDKRKERKEKRLDRKREKQKNRDEKKG
jgi:hypothetical protein